MIHLDPPSHSPLNHHQHLADSYSDYAIFLNPAFDAEKFAHAVVNNEPLDVPNSPLPGAAGAVGSSSSGTKSIFTNKGLGSSNGVVESGDVGAALSKLNFGVEDLNRQLKAEITKHHEALLIQVASLGSLSTDLKQVRQGLSEVESGVVRLRRKITLPHSSLSSSLALLTRLQRASSLARRASRFAVLARRLELQMIEVEGGDTSLRIDSIAEQTSTPPRDPMRSSIGAGEYGESSTLRGNRRDRAMAEAALTLAEIQSLLTSHRTVEHDDEEVLPIEALRAIALHIPSVESSRNRVVETMEEMVERGMTHLDNPVLASSLQIAHNLSVLPTLVQSLVAELNARATKRIKACFDMVSLGREMNKDAAPTSAAAAFVYKSRARNEPTNVTLPLWTSAMWMRLEELLTALGEICIKLYTLEKVLHLKRDQVTGSTFLEEAMGTMDGQPSTLFWTNMSKEFEHAAKESVRSSNFLQTTLASGYPRLLRLFQEFFEHVGGVSGTVYSAASQSPETILVLRAIQPFESLYLTRTTNRLNESISSAFSLASTSNSLSLSSSFSSASRSATIPTGNEGQTCARTIVNELDKAKFDPLLIQAVAKGVVRGIELFVTKSQALILLDHTANSLLGPLATPAQHTNSSIASALFQLYTPLNRALSESDDGVKEILKSSVESIRITYLSIVNPLLSAIRTSFSSIIAKMHRVDYSKPTIETSTLNGNGVGGGASGYMSELSDKLTLVREEILGSHWKVGELVKEWALDLARFAVQTYVLHASLVRSLSESGKLALTSDTTALEFAIASYLSSYSISLASLGDQHKALRAFRPLLFLDVEEVRQAETVKDVPVLILLHHLVGRSKGLKLPHEVKGTNEAEYVNGLNNEQDERQRIEMIEECVNLSEQSDEEDEELVIAVKEVLERWKRSQV